MEEKRNAVTNEKFAEIRCTLCQSIPMELLSQMTDLQLNELRDILDSYSAAISTMISNRKHIYIHASKNPHK